MKLINKYLNILSKEQIILIEKQIELVSQLGTEECKKLYDLNKEFDHRINSTCPLCNDKDIVNKINTIPINHCNSCGNEWEKSISNNYTITDLILDYLKDVLVTIEGKYTFGKKKYDELKELNIYAETLFWMMNEYSHLSRFRYENFNLKDLRKHFKSIHDL